VELGASRCSAHCGEIDGRATKLEESESEMEQRMESETEQRTG
jgi:hypothetical protein